MRKPAKILKRDLLALVKNPIALLVVGALLVLPGLYAWYCIVANWDPYSNTGNMPIAVVNHDKGASHNLAGDVNIGEMVTDKLKDNEKIDWKFYDSEDEALLDTEYGLVYATLVLPEDLSENMVGIFEGSNEKPVIKYYPNEKYNAVATKVTDSATQTLIRQINQGFASKVNEKILESSQKIAKKVDERADESRKSALEEIKSFQADLRKVSVSLDHVVSSIEGWREAASSANSALGATAGQLAEIRTLLSRGSGELDEFSAATSELESSMSSTILKSASTISRLSGEANMSLADAVTDLKAVKSSLEALSKAAGSDEDLRDAVDSMEAIVAVLDGMVSKASEDMDKLDTKVQAMIGNVTKATETISGEVMPQLNEGAHGVSMSMSMLAGAVGQFEPQIVSLQSVLTQTDAALLDAKDTIYDAKQLLNTVGTHLEGTVTDIGTIRNALQINEMSELLNVDPDALGSFISMPVKLETEKVFPVSNYGTAVAPFYTNLALWIGCFILVSLMKVEVAGEEALSATRRERYYGRWLLFVILSLLQSQVICGVDILLGIDCANPALFMLAGAVCSFAYMNLIYALVKTFRNIGKTLCIFLLIMQVPGSSGMYPIEMMPGFFQFIHPALPFTYGIDAMREALSGLHGWSYVLDLVVLLLIVPGSLLIGLGLRPVMGNLLALFDEEMNKTGFFASEEYQGAESSRMRSMMRSLASDSKFSDDIEERAFRFNRMYPRWRRVGSIATLAIPLACLVVMLPINVLATLSADTKLTVLIIMLIVLFVVQIGLIVLEYMHRTISEEVRLLGADLLDDIDMKSLTSGEDGAGEQTIGMVPALASIGTSHAKDESGRGLTGRLARGAKSGPARDIFMTDLRLGLRSVVGLVVIVLLVITPSLYAWFNIAGSWDPYGSTGNLKVAVATEDEGYKGDLIPVTVNVGDVVVSQLRGNKNFDWEFVNKDELLEGMESGRYYAAVEIPRNFSRNLMTYLTSDTEYPDVVYYTNEKLNPIAPIITQKGADAIQENIRTDFTENVDKVALSVAYDVLNYVKAPAFQDFVSKMGQHLDDATHDAKWAARELRSLAGLANTTAGIVDTTGTAIDGMQAAGASAKEAIGSAEAGAQSAAAAIDKASAAVEGLLAGRTTDTSKIAEIIDAAFIALEVGASAVPDMIDDATYTVKELKKGHPKVDAAKFDAVIESLDALHADAVAAVERITSAHAEIDGVIQDATGEVEAVKSYYRSSVAPALERLRGTINSLMTSTSQVVEGLEGSLQGVDNGTDGLSNQLRSLSAGLTKSGSKLEKSAKEIEDTKARVAEALKSGNIKQIGAVILGNDPEVLAKSLATPLSQEREAMYPVSNYGSAMAPFYTVLALWVGALVMISTMRVHVVEERIEELRKRYGRVHPRQEFFGRYGIFGTIGLLQSVLVLLGDLCLLHIQCENPVMFFLFGIFIGQVFCLIVYTITELFGDVGKAICVILLIMQVAASGGTFPAEMLHPILLNIVEFLPFAHAMTLLQECVAGIAWLRAAIHVAALLAMVGGILILGLPLRRPFRKLNIFFEEQLEKTGYM